VKGKLPDHTVIVQKPVIKSDLLASIDAWTTRLSRSAREQS
jgi:hypothetical protein